MEREGWRGANGGNDRDTRGSGGKRGVLRCQAGERPTHDDGADAVCDRVRHDLDGRREQQTGLVVTGDALAVAELAFRDSSLAIHDDRICRRHAAGVKARTEPIRGRPRHCDGRLAGAHLGWASPDHTVGKGPGLPVGRDGGVWPAPWQG